MTNLRPFLAGLMAGLALGSSAGCNIDPCTPQNCAGCCDDRGQCEAGNEPAACGLAGSACINCGADVCNPNGTCFGTYLPVPNDGGLDDLLPYANFVDAGIIDAGAVDAGELDGGGLDAGGADAGGVDAGGVDAGIVDAGGVDAGAFDAGARDAGVDAGTIDAGAFLPRDVCDPPLDLSGLDAGTFADRPVADFSGGRVLLAFVAQNSATALRTLQTRLYETGAWGPAVSHVTNNSVFLWQDELTLSPAGNAGLTWVTGPGLAGRRVYSRLLNTWATVPWASAPNIGERNRLFWTGPDTFFHGWYGLSTPLYAVASPTGVEPDEALTSVIGQAVDFVAARMVDGDTAAVWRDANRVFLGRFIDAFGQQKEGGESRLIEPVAAAFIGRPAIGALPTGDALMLWERRSNSGTVELMAVELRDAVPDNEGNDPKPVFEPPVVLAQTTSAQAYGLLQVLVDDTGDVTATWQSSNASTWALRRVGGVWGTPVQLGAAGLAHNRRAVIDDYGHVTVATFNNATSFRVQLRRIEKGASTWGPAYFATPNTFGAAALALSAAGEPMVFYRENSALSPIKTTTCR
ncbi:MAG: hypothetical protein Q8N26_04155 [Myxococcales bacterium]|nr:hypothetical protein [Myxococcales bacterium]